MTPIQWTILAAAVAAVILILILIRLLLVRNDRKKGVDGTKKVSRILKRFAGIRSFKVLNDLTLKTAKKNVHIDHILIGFFGIMVVNTQNLPGSIYGDGRGKNWTHVVTKNGRETKTSFPNPLLENQQAVDAVREVLSTNGVYKVNIESWVVFTRKKASLNLPKGLSVLGIKDFKKLLKKSRYSADGNVNVPQVASLLSANRVK